MVTDTTSAIFLSEHTQAMCFVDHNIGVVFSSQFHNLRQVCQIALHTEDTVHNNKFHLSWIATFKLFLQRGHIVVSKLKFCRERSSNSLNDGSMISFIPDDIFISSCETSQHPFIDRETS